MSLSPGTRIGGYEIIGPLGAGGMGEVYRARDARLGRDAAIKILPDLFLNDPDRVSRFEREARTLASLNHPNIAGIYGIVEAGIVMELVEGEDLSVILARGRVPLAEALPIARQIASALEAAHELGIVHRDLKPANVKVRPDGTVKVLDFGLATPGGSNDASGSLANSPTMTSPAATAFGMIIGTAAYMSPEQARGKVVDKRADVWAFGVVLYEMLSGQRAYGGNEVSDVLASVLKDTLPLDAVPATTPAPIRRLLRRCLEKDRADRLDSMATARLEIADAMAPGKDESAAITSITPPNRRRAFLTSAAAVVLVSAITGLVAWQARAPAPLEPASLVLAPPMGERVQINVNQPDVAISHDGRHIAYGNGGVGSTIMLRSLDQFVDTPLSGLGAQPRSPFFSADDKWLGYFIGDSNGANGRLMKVPVSGGPPIEIAPVAGNLRGASWSADGSIVFGNSVLASGLMRVSVAGGQPEVLTKPDEAQNEFDHLWPVLMPDGKHAVFAISRRPDTATAVSLDLAVLDLSTRKWRVIKSGASFPRFVATGHLLYANAQGIFAAPFDPVACEFRGDELRVIEGAAFKVASGGADISVSDGGSLAYVAGAALSTKTLAWVGPSAVVTPIAAPPHNYLDAVLSPDHTRIAVTMDDDGGSALGVFDLARGSFNQVLPVNVVAFGPVWSADRRSIYYRKASGASQGVYRTSADGAGTPELVLERKATEVLRPTSVTPDGQSILVTRSEGTTYEILQVNLTGKPEPKRIVADGNWSTTGQISPDGRWLAYTVRSNFGAEVFLRPYPNVTGERVQVSTNGGLSPVWAWNGRAIFYSGYGRTGIWRVAMAANGQLGKPVLLLAPDSSIAQATDIATGGDRQLRLQPVVDSGKTNELRLVLNWFEVLKQKMSLK